MMDLLSIFNQEHFFRIGLFVLSALFGMIYSYAYKWADSASPLTLWQYLTGDSKSTAKALCALLAATLGAGSLSYLDALSASEIMVAGAGIGALIPGKLISKEMKNGT